METVLAAAILLALALWAVRRVRGGGGGSPRTRKACRWERTGAGSGALTQFRCRTCGVVAYSAEPGGPVQCKKDFDGG